MSANDGVVAEAIGRLALAADGAILGLTLAFAAVQTWIAFFSSSSSLDKIRRAAGVTVSDLRSVSPSASEGESNENRMVVLRGQVQAKSSVNGDWKNFKSTFLVSHGTGEKAVILQRTQTCLYNEWKGLFGWTSDLHSLFSRSWKEQESSFMRMVPFVLVECSQWSHSNYVTVNLDGSTQPLPLTTVYHQLRPVQASPYTFLQVIFGYGYPVGLLDEEKILPVGKEISAVGIYSLRDGVPEIKSCKDLPFFLSELTKEQMIVELSTRKKVLLWSGIILGTLSFSILGYSIVRNWFRWKEWRNRRHVQQPTEPSLENTSDEDSGDVPDGELCVICLSRRRGAAFVPCGHLVCCPHCALLIEQDLTPKCPVCRQDIRNSIRIYAS